MLITLYIVLYLLAGIITAAVLEKKCGRDDEFMTGVCVFIWPPFVVAFIAGVVFGLLAKAVTAIANLTK